MGKGSKIGRRFGRWGKCMKRPVVLLLFGSTLYSTPLYAKTWAAQFPYGAGELSPVFHAESRENVLAKAEAFCQKNALCRDQYQAEVKSAVATGVIGFTNLFVTTLCKQKGGEPTYVTAPSLYNDKEGREDGKQVGLRKIEDAGLSTEDCLIHAVYGVKSGGKLPTDLAAPTTEEITVKVTTEFSRPRKEQRRHATRTVRD
jgi:hypothetical protein